jgi:hypothetical protein
MATSLGENNREQANLIVVGQILPPSGIDAKYIKVGQNYKMFYNILPQVLQDLNDPKWKNVSFLKKQFTKPLKGTQQKCQAV